MSKDRTPRSTALKCLRIGLIQGGQLRDERVFHSPQAITIGMAPDSTFPVDDARLREPFALLIPEADGYRLQVADWMRGQLNLDAGAQFDLAGKPDDERFTAMPGGYSVALSDAARGKVVAGPLTVLFQFIDATSALAEAAPAGARAMALAASGEAPVQDLEESASVAQAAEGLRAAEARAQAARSALRAAEAAAAAAADAVQEAHRLLAEAKKREAAERARREAEARAAREAAERAAAEKAALEARERAEREAAAQRERAAREEAEAARRAASRFPVQSAIEVRADVSRPPQVTGAGRPQAAEATPLPYRDDGPFNSMDRIFLAVLLATFSINFGAVFAISLRPDVEPVELTLEDIPERFAQVILPDRPKEEEIPASDAPAGEEAPEEKAEVKVAAKEAKATSSGSAQPVDAAARTAAIREGIQGKGLLKMLGALGDDGEGGDAIQDVLGGGSDATSDIASALMGASGVGVATADSLARAAGQRLGGGTGEAAGIGDLGTSGGAGVQARQFAEKKTVNIRGRVIDEGPEIDSASCDRDAIARFVKARMKSIQNCYEKELKRNPSLKGKIVVRFTIDESGKPIEVEIEEDTMDNSRVTTCIRSTIRMWRFPIKDNECPVAYPFIFTPSSS